jgi:hypothetical protein
VILEWTNHDCPYVKKHYESGNMQALQQGGHRQAGYTWLSVDLVSTRQAGTRQPGAGRSADRVPQRGTHRGAAGLRGQIGKAYGARTTPHMFVIDEQGTSWSTWAASTTSPSTNPADVEGAENYVRLAMADLAAGKPVGKAVTRPYGCSIKY